MSDKKNVVMVVDDNAFVRALMKRWLGDDAIVIEIENGMGVMQAYADADQKPDIIFLDIHMPGRNGKHVMRDLRQAYPDAYVVMISGDSNKVNIFSSMYAGAQAFISKPFTRDTLTRYYRRRCPEMPEKEAAYAEA